MAKWDVWTGKTYRLRNGDGASAGSRIPVKLLPRESMLIAVGPEAAATDGPLIDPDTLTPVAQLADWDLTGSESPWVSGNRTDGFRVDWTGRIKIYRELHAKRDERERLGPAFQPRMNTNKGS